MKKIFFLIYISSFILLFSYNFHSIYEIIDKNDIYYKVIKDLNYTEVKIPILEAETLEEFTNLTKLPYSYYNGAMMKLKEQKYIILIPFRYFEVRKDIEKTVTHELFHYYLTNKTKMNAYEQEGIILNLLNDYKNRNDYEEFQKMNYYEIIKYIKTRELN